MATGRIKGQAGTKVTLDGRHPGRGKRRARSRSSASKIDVPVARRPRWSSATARRSASSELLSFSTGAHGQLRAGDRQAAASRAPRAIVLDLRGNGGGLLREAVLVSSIFIEDGLIVSIAGRNRAGAQVERRGRRDRRGDPVVVLVDGGSASASEIVTGALRDRGRAHASWAADVRQGRFQEVEPLSNGGVLDLTVGHYYLPSGENIADEGHRAAGQGRATSRDTERDEALPVALDELLASRDERGGRGRPGRRLDQPMRRGAREARPLPGRRAAVRAGPRDRALDGAAGRAWATSCCSAPASAARACVRTHRPAGRGPRRARGADARPRPAPLVPARGGGRGRTRPDDPTRRRARAWTCASCPPSRSTRDDARDFDDAISAQREDGRVRLWVHIADVTRLRAPGRRARARGVPPRDTSVYVPGAVEPMLPEALSNEALLAAARARTGWR